MWLQSSSVAMLWVYKVLCTVNVMNVHRHNYSLDSTIMRRLEDKKKSELVFLCEWHRRRRRRRRACSSSLPPSLPPLQIDVTVSVPEDWALPVDPVPAAAPWGSPRPVCWMRPNPTTSKVTEIGTVAFWSDPSAPRKHVGGRSCGFSFTGNFLFSRVVLSWSLIVSGNRLMSRGNGL